MTSSNLMGPRCPETQAALQKDPQPFDSTPGDATALGGACSAPVAADAPRILDALERLFRNPMPYDLIAIRREVQTEYGGDDEAAKSDMEVWCSNECMERALQAHRDAWHNAAEVLQVFKKTTPALTPSPVPSGG